LIILAEMQIADNNARICQTIIHDVAGSGGVADINLDQFARLASKQLWTRVVKIV
jgi:hypothetical protein